MTNPIENLHKAFDNRIRLGIMSSLMANTAMDFKSLKTLMNITDGNLASHLKGLEKEDFISVHKSFKGRKPHTEYLATNAGRKAFEAHINALESLIKQQLKTI